MKPAQNEKALADLVEILSRGEFVTARRIAVEMRCAKMVAYLRVQALKKRGCTLQVQKVREGFSGPLSQGYAIIPNEASKTLLRRRVFLTKRRAAS